MAKWALATLCLVVPAHAAARPYLQGAWLYTQHLGWNLTLHQRELAAMRALDMNTIIAGVAVHCDFSGDAFEADPCTPPRVTDTTCQSYYPSKLPWVEQQAADNLELILRAADGQGMEVHLGLVSSGQFFSDTSEGFLGRLFVRSAQVADELYARFGGHPSLKGMYITQEVDNREWGTEDKRRALVERLLAPLSAHIKSLDPTLMVSTAPYFIRQCAGPTDWGAFWNATLAELPHVDTLIPQDCIGGTHRQSSAIGESLEYLRAMRRACDRHGKAMWSDMELFVSHFLPNKTRLASSPASVSRVLSQLHAEAPLVDRFLSFEFHQYLSPLNPRLAPNPLYTGYLRYLEGERPP